MKKYLNEPKSGAVCWCCGAEAEWYGTKTKVNWCFPCKYGDPECSGPCNVERFLPATTVDKINHGDEGVA